MAWRDAQRSSAPSTSVRDELARVPPARWVDATVGLPQSIASRLHRRGDRAWSTTSRAVIPGLRSARAGLAPRRDRARRALGAFRRSHSRPRKSSEGGPVGRKNALSKWAHTRFSSVRALTSGKRSVGSEKAMLRRPPAKRKPFAGVSAHGLRIRCRTRPPRRPRVAARRLRPLAGIDASDIDDGRWGAHSEGSWL